MEKVFTSLNAFQNPTTIHSLNKDCLCVVFEFLKPVPELLIACCVSRSFRDTAHSIPMIDVSFEAYNSIKLNQISRIFSLFPPQKLLHLDIVGKNTSSFIY